MLDYPVKFTSRSASNRGEDKWSLETEESLEISMDVPVEFGGSDKNSSPEDLFNASLNTCILATFKITARRKGLEFDEITVESETFLDRNEDGRPVMKKTNVTVEVYGVNDKDLGREVSEITGKNCFIHNSVKTEINTEFKFD